mgnify:CR=1 FL=1
MLDEVHLAHSAPADQPVDEVRTEPVAGAHGCRHADKRRVPGSFAGADPTDVGTADLARTNPDGVSHAGDAAVSPVRRHTSN